LIKLEVNRPLESSGSVALLFQGRKNI